MPRSVEAPGILDAVLSFVPPRFKDMTSQFVSSVTEPLTAASTAGFQKVQSLPAFVAGRRGAQDALSDLPKPHCVAAAVIDVLGAFLVMLCFLIVTGMIWLQHPDVTGNF